MSKQHLGDNEFFGLIKIGAATKQATFDASGLTTNRTITVPDAAGTLALRSTTLSGYGITDAVNTTGNQTVDGVKTFVKTVVLSNAAAGGDGVSLDITSTAKTGSAISSYKFWNLSSTGYTAGLTVYAYPASGGLVPRWRIRDDGGFDFLGTAGVANLQIGNGGDLVFFKDVAQIQMLSPGSVNGYEVMSNVSDTVDGGMLIRRWNGSGWDSIASFVSGSFQIAPTVLTVNPFKITGAFTGSGRTVAWSNTDTSAGTAMSLLLASGATGQGQVSVFGSEYTAVAAWTNRTLVESTTGTGVSYSALASGGNHKWYVGAARTQVLGLDGNGLTIFAGANFGSVAATGVDCSSHIELYSTTYGINIISNTLQIVSNSKAFQFDGLNGDLTLPSTGSLVASTKVVTANATTTLGTTHLNRSVEKSDTVAYTYTLAASLGNGGDTIHIVNSGTSGNITVARAASVVLLKDGVDANITVAPGYGVTLYRTATANRWIVL